MNSFTMRTWAEIDLDALRSNVDKIRATLPPTTSLTAVVKADCYGHGADLVARELNIMGINSFAVSNIEEAVALRRAGILGDILILGYTPVSAVPLLAEYNISQAVFSLQYAHALSSEAISKTVSVAVHIKVDTGMGRIGFMADTTHIAVDDIVSSCKLPRLEVKGIFTHFSSADSLDQEAMAYTKMQENLFYRTLESLEELGITFEYVHMQNSAAIAFHSAARVTHARAGIILYGEPPSAEKFPIPLKPVMSLKSVIAMVKRCPAGKSFSYGRTYTSSKDITVATVPIGYADGYPRLLSNKGEMLVKGVRCPIIGNICMDQLLLDVSAVPNINVGDVVTVVGASENDTISFGELADKIGTINYELMCLIGRRVPRVYIRGGKTIEIVDYISK